jgi:hypothetical protein
VALAAAVLLMEQEAQVLRVKVIMAHQVIVETHSKAAAAAAQVKLGKHKLAVTVLRG